MFKGWVITFCLRQSWIYRSRVCCLGTGQREGLQILFGEQINSLAGDIVMWKTVVHNSGATAERPLAKMVLNGSWSVIMMIITVLQHDHELVILIIFFTKNVAGDWFMAEISSEVTLSGRKWTGSDRNWTGKDRSWTRSDRNWTGSDRKWLELNQNWTYSKKVVNLFREIRLS